MEDSNDGFELNFNYDVVDMTDTGCQSGMDIYGTDNNAQDDDIYGLYKPGRSYESRAEANAAKRADRIQKSEKTYATFNVLYYIAIWSVVGISALSEYNSYISLPVFEFVSIFYSVVIIIDICMMYSRYKRISLLGTGFLFTMLYPVFRSHARQESQLLSGLWLLVYISILFFR